MKQLLTFCFGIALPTVLSGMDFVISTPTSVAATMLTQQIAARRLKAHKLVCHEAQTLLNIVNVQRAEHDIQHQATTSTDVSRLVKKLFVRACDLSVEESPCATQYYYFSQQITPILKVIATDAPEGLDRIEQLLSDNAQHVFIFPSAFNTFLLDMLNSSKSKANEPCCSIL